MEPGSTHDYGRGLALLTWVETRNSKLVPYPHLTVRATRAHSMQASSASTHLASGQRVEPSHPSAWRPPGLHAVRRRRLFMNFQFRVSNFKFPSSPSIAQPPDERLRQPGVLHLLLSLVDIVG